MELWAWIVDDKTKQGLPNATVSVLDANGTPRGINAVADSEGYFYLNSDAINLSDKLQISSVGYSTYVYPVQYVATYNYDYTDLDIGLQEHDIELPGVTISSGTKNSLPLLVGGGLLLFALAKKDDKKKSKKVSGIPGGAFGTLLLVGAGAYLYLKLNPNKSQKIQFLIQNNYTTGVITDFIAFNDDYISAWYAAAKHGAQTFTYLAKSYHTQGGTAV